MHTTWTGVFPAATTPFDATGALDTAAMERHLDRLVRAGVHGLVVNGSLGEAGTLTRAEKLTAIRCAQAAASGRVPVLTGLAETTTEAGRTFAAEAAAAGATGIMLLPPMQYVSDRAKRWPTSELSPNRRPSRSCSIITRSRTAWTSRPRCSRTLPPTGVRRPQGVLRRSAPDHGHHQPGRGPLPHLRRRRRPRARKPPARSGRMGRRPRVRFPRRDRRALHARP